MHVLVVLFLLIVVVIIIPGITTCKVVVPGIINETGFISRHSTDKKY